MRTVAQILQVKERRGVFTIGPEATVYEAVRRMADADVGALLVTQEDRIFGIVSERDYARKLVLMDRSPTDARVSDIMSAPVLYVSLHHTSQQCMALMTENRLRHLPVMEHDKLVGLVSIGDLVKDIISEQQFIIEQLEHYIMGERA